MKTKKGGLSLIGYIVFFLLALTLIPVIKTLISDGGNKYVCNDEIYNTLYNTSLCLNTTTYINSTTTGYITGTSVGLSTTEALILGVMVLIVMISLVLGVYGVGMGKIKK